MSYSSEVLADAPLIYWRLGDASGTTCTDSSGNARNGTYTNTPTLGVTGLISNTTDTAVTFNGSTQYVNLASATYMNISSYTIEFWFKTTQSTQGLMASRDDASTKLWNVQINSGQVILGTYNGTTGQNCTTAATYNDGVRHHVVAQKNGTTLTIWIDNVQAATTSAFTTFNTTGTVVLNLARRGNNTLYFNGTLDEFAFYSTNLSTSRIQAHWQAGTGTGIAAVSLGGLTVSGSGAIARTGSADVVLGDLTVTAHSPFQSGTAAVDLGGLDVAATGNVVFQVRCDLGGLDVEATGAVSYDEPDYEAVTLAEPVSFSMIVHQVTMDSYPVDTDIISDQDLNYTAPDNVPITLYTKRRLLSAVYLELPDPVVTVGKPRLPAILGEFSSSITVTQGSGHAHVVNDPDPGNPGVDPPPTTSPNTDGAGYVRWTVRDLPDPHDFAGGYYFLGDSTSLDGSDAYGDTNCYQWHPNSTSTMPSAPDWNSHFPFKPEVAAHTWYGPTGNLHTESIALRFNTDYIQHMWIDMGSGADSSPPQTWVVVGLIQNFDYDAQRHPILDSGKAPSASGISWTLANMNQIVQLPADPSGYRLAMEVSQERMIGFTSFQEGQKTLRVPFVHDYKPRMFAMVAAGASNSMVGYISQNGRKMRSGSLDSASHFQHLVLGRRNGILSPHHAAHLVVFEIRMWNRALDLTELDAQYDQLASTWKFAQYY